MGTRGGGAGRLVFKDVQVPAENMILNEGDGGRIFYQMMYPERIDQRCRGYRNVHGGSPTRYEIFHETESLR